MPRNGPARKPAVVSAHLAEIAARYLRGETQAAIGAALGLSQQQVSVDLRVLQAEWTERAAATIDAAKAAELARLDNLEREYWAAWERSRTPRETATTGSTQAPGPPAKGATAPKPVTIKQDARIVKVARDGNPAFLAGVLSCIDRRCKLLGVDAPQKIAPTTPDGAAPYQPADLSRLTPAQLDALAAIRATLDGGG